MDHYDRRKFSLAGDLMTCVVGLGPLRARVHCAQTVPKHPEQPLTEPHGTASASPLSRCKY